MAARGKGESAKVLSSAFPVGDRAGAIPGILMSQGVSLQEAASGQGCHDRAGPSRADPGGRRLGRLPGRPVTGRVPLASRDPERRRSPLEPVVVRAPLERGRVARRSEPRVGAIFDRDELFDAS
jgi:hypothetical protein